MTVQKRNRTAGEPPTLLVKDKKGNNKLVKSDNYTRLLGSNISRNLRWTEHLISGDSTVLPNVREKNWSTQNVSQQTSIKKQAYPYPMDL